jgi:hypothetical protein
MLNMIYGANEILLMYLLIPPNPQTIACHYPKITPHHAVNSFVQLVVFLVYILLVFFASGLEFLILIEDLSNIFC